MSTEKSVRQAAAEWNDRARAEGRLLEQDPWSLPRLYEGLILDVPTTPDAEERVRQLDSLLAGLDPQNAATTAEHRPNGEDGTGWLLD